MGEVTPAIRLLVRIVEKKDSQGRAWKLQTPVPTFLRNLAKRKRKKLFVAQPCKRQGTCRGGKERKGSREQEAMDSFNPGRATSSDASRPGGDTTELKQVK